MGGKHKQAQRVKNNTRPSSSGRSAERLGTIPPPFATTFTNLNKDNASFGLILDDPTLSQLDPTLDPQFQLVLKKMNKKDGTTKLKALQEFRQLLETSDSEAVGLVTGLWCRVYVSLLTGSEGRVREAAHRAHELICSRAARSLAPHIRLIAAPWLASQYDTYSPAAQAAKDSLLAAFPDSTKRDQLATRCRRQIIQQALDALNTEPRDERVISCALCAASAACQQENIEIKNQEEVELLKKILENDRFWKPEGDSEKIGWATMLASLCHEPWRELTSLDCAKALKNVLPNLFNATVPDCLSALWDIVILLLPHYSSNLDLNRVLIEPLIKQLKDPGPGIVTRICPALLPLCARLPPDTDHNEKKLKTLEKNSSALVKSSSALDNSSSTLEKNSSTSEKISSTREKNYSTSEKSCSTREKSTNASEKGSSTREKNSSALEKSSSTREKCSSASEKSSSTREKNSSASEKSSDTQEKSPSASEKTSIAMETSSSAPENSSSAQEKNSIILENRPNLSTPEKILDALLETIQKPYIQHSRVELSSVSSAYMDIIQWASNSTGLAQLITQIYTPEQDPKRLKTINIEISKLLKRWKGAQKIWELLTDFIKNDSINQILIADLILTLGLPDKNRGVQFSDEVQKNQGVHFSEKIEKSQEARISLKIEKNQGSQISEKIDKNSGAQFSEKIKNKQGTQIFEKIEKNQKSQISENFEKNKWTQISENIEKNQGTQISEKFEKNQETQISENFEKNQWVQLSEKFEKNEGTQISEKFEKNQGTQNSEKNKGSQFLEKLDKGTQISEPNNKNLEVQFSEMQKNSHFYLKNIQNLEKTAIKIWLEKCKDPIILGALLILLRGCRDPNLIPKGAFETILPILGSPNLENIPNLVELIFIILKTVESKEKIEILDTLPFQAVPYAIKEAQKSSKTYQKWLQESQNVQKVYLNTALEICDPDFNYNDNFEILKISLGARPLLCHQNTLKEISKIFCGALDDSNNINHSVLEVAPIICDMDPNNLAPRLFKISCYPKEIDEHLLIEIEDAWVGALKKIPTLTDLVLVELYSLVGSENPEALLRPLILLLCTNFGVFEQVFFRDPFKEVEGALKNGVLLSNYIMGTFQDKILENGFPGYFDVVSWINWKKLVGATILKFRNTNLEEFFDKIARPDLKISDEITKVSESDSKNLDISKMSGPDTKYLDILKISGPEKLKEILKRISVDFLSNYALGATFVEIFTHLNFSGVLENWVNDAKKICGSIKTQLELNEKDWWDNTPNESNFDIIFWSIGTSFLVSEGLLPLKTLGVRAPHLLYLTQAVAPRGLLKPERIQTGLGSLISTRLSILAEHDPDSIETVIAEGIHALKALNPKNLGANEKIEACLLLGAALVKSRNEKLIDMATVFLAEWSKNIERAPKGEPEYLKFVWAYSKLVEVHLSNLSGDQKKEFDELFAKDVRGAIFRSFTLVTELAKNGSPLVWPLTPVVYEALIQVNNGDDVLWGLSLGAIETKNVPIQIFGFYILNFLCEMATTKGGQSPGHFSQKLLILLNNKNERLSQNEIVMSDIENRASGSDELVASIGSNCPKNEFRVSENENLSQKEDKKDCQGSEIEFKGSQNEFQLSQNQKLSPYKAKNLSCVLQNEIYKDLSCVLAWGAASGLHAAWEQKNVEIFLKRLLTHIPNDPKDEWFSLGDENNLSNENNLAKVLQKVSCQIFTRFLTDAGAACRSWWMNSNLTSSERQRIEKLASKHVTRRAIKAQLASKYLPDGVKCSMAGRLIQAECYIEDARIELKIELRESWPLGQLPPIVEAKPAPHRDRLMQITLAAVAGAPLHRLLKLWKDAVDRRYEGLDECHICFSLLYAATAQLPKLKCPTCKKSFHSACLYRWFSTSNKSTCPLCRNLF